MDAQSVFEYSRADPIRTAFGGWGHREQNSRSEKHLKTGGDPIIRGDTVFKSPAFIVTDRDATTLAQPHSRFLPDRPMSTDVWMEKIPYPRGFVRF